MSDLDLDAVMERFGKATWPDVAASYGDVPKLVAEIRRLRAKMPSDGGEWITEYGTPPSLNWSPWRRGPETHRRQLWVGDPERIEGV